MLYKVLILRVRVGPGVMAMKRLSTLPRPPELEPHHQTHLSVTPRTMTKLTLKRINILCHTNLSKNTLHFNIFENYKSVESGKEASLLFVPATPSSQRNKGRFYCFSLQLDLVTFCAYIRWRAASFVGGFCGDMTFDHIFFQRS